MLRYGTPEAFDWIVNEVNTAHFVFLPVSDAHAADLDRRGSHWSLLLVDRRNPSCPIAYHFDSAWDYGSGRAHNQEPAALLARAMGAYLQPGMIRQQENAFDCGDYVLEGARELVRRLQGPEPNLWDLRGVVADRQQLQERLRAARLHLQANDPADRAGPSTQSVHLQEVDRAGQPAFDLNRPDHWQAAGLEFPHLGDWPAQSVNPPPWQQTAAASLLGVTPQMPPPAPDLGQYVPGWIDGDQRAPGALMRGMHWHDVLPSVKRLTTSFTINGVLYTAEPGRKKMRNEIYVYQKR